ncbi:MAG: glycosyltransferase family 4 protein [bacterium]
MKILFLYETITDPLYELGSQNHNARVQESFRKIGHDVVLLDDSHDNSNGKVASYRNLYQRIIKRYLPEQLAVIPRDIYDIYRDKVIYRKKVESFVEKNQPEMIFERFTPMHTAGLEVAKRKKIPIIMEVHSPWEEVGEYFSTESLPWYSKNVYKNALLGADAIIVVSSSMKKYLCDRWGACEDKIHVIPNAVDQEFFHPVIPGKIEKIKDKYHLHGKKIIGFIGSMAPYHGLNYLIEASKEVVQQEKNVIFLLIGSFRKEEAKKAVLDEIDNYGLQDYFLFTGKVNYLDIPSYIDCMDICVLPSGNNWYGSPIKLFEYGARGKLVIAGRLSPIEDVIEDSREGILFDPKSPKDLARKILYALREHDNIKDMGLQLQRKISANHTWAHNASRIQSIANGLMRRDH